MTTVHPYLTFNGNCEEAFNFYKAIFGGDFGYLGRYKDIPGDAPIPDSEKEKIMHISLCIGNTVLMGADASKAFGQEEVKGNNIAISINTDNEAEAKRLFDGLSAQGTVTMPLDKTFWNAYFGMFIDKFGIHWMVNYDYEQQG